MYDLPKIDIANDMKKDITKTSEIKIKLISNDFFNLDNLCFIRTFLDPNRLSITSIDIGIDRVLKFTSNINIGTIIQNYEIPHILRNWINSSINRKLLLTILTEEELEFFDLHFEMFYQIETFNATNILFVRI